MTAPPSVTAEPSGPASARLSPRVLGSGALAGLAGGLIAGLVALLVAWPALDAAVALEEAAAAAHAAAGVEGSPGGVAVSREVQRVGGIVGLATVGAVLGAGLAAAQAVAARRGATRGGAVAEPVFHRCARLGLAVLAAVVVVPQLAHPPLPPGASSTGGDPLAAVALGVGVVAAYLLARAAARERGALGPVTETGLVAGAVLLALAGGWLLPDRETLSVSVPAELLWDFRVGALAVQVVLVLATAALLGVFLDLAERRASRARGQVPARPGPAR